MNTVAEIREAHINLINWSYREEKRLLFDHIPERGARKEALRAKCAATGHYWHPYEPYCKDCHYKQLPDIVYPPSRADSDPEIVAEHERIKAWSNAVAKDLLKDHMIARSEKLKPIQRACGELGHIYVNHKFGRYICVNCEARSTRIRSKDQRFNIDFQWSFYMKEDFTSGATP